MGKNKKSNQTENKRHDIHPAILLSVFDLAIYLMLATVFANYLRKVEGLSFFLPSLVHYDECMRVPGGLVSWCSTFLTQFMYYPWVGGAVFVLLLALVQLLCVKAFKLGRQNMALVFIPSVLILLSFTNLGYLIFTLRPAGCFLSLPIGIIFNLCALLIYDSLRRWWVRCVMVALVVVAGYYPFGFYSLLAASLCCASTVTGRSRWRFAVIAVAVSSMAAVPYLWFSYIGKGLMESQTYISGIPYFYKSEVGWWALYAAVYALMLTGAVLTSRFAKYRGSEVRHGRMDIGLFAAAALFVAIFRYSDSNFLHTLDLDRAMWDEDWQAAVALTEDYHGDADRLNTVLGYLSLRRAGLAPDRMFAVKYGWEPYHTSRDARAMHDGAAATVSYHLGLINYANRWCMEYNIGQGLSIERIMLLAKCALLNYELPLAKKYLEIVYNTPWRRDWAKRYLRYVSNPVEMTSDPELSAIRQLMCHQNVFINDGGAFESYIWPLLASATGGTPEFVDLSMQAALISRDLDSFMPKLLSYVECSRRVPRHYQEAALLWSMLNNAPTPAFVEPQTADRHNRFISIFRSLSQLSPEQQRDMMKESFADTYWYYFIFTEDCHAI